MARSLGYGGGWTNKDNPPGRRLMTPGEGASSEAGHFGLAEKEGCQPTHIGVPLWLPSCQVANPPTHTGVPLFPDWNQIQLGVEQYPDTHLPLGESLFSSIGKPTAFLCSPPPGVRSRRYFKIRVKSIPDTLMTERSIPLVQFFFGGDHVIRNAFHSVVGSTGAFC